MVLTKEVVRSRLKGGGSVAYHKGASGRQKLWFTEQKAGDLGDLNALEGCP
jgi:hypothetical protein